MDKHHQIIQYNYTNISKLCYSKIENYYFKTREYKNK